MRNVDTAEESPTVLSLCPGMLGLERGLERAIGRVKVVAYVEIEAFIIENLVCAMEQGFLDPAPIWSNIKTFDWEILRGKVDLITGGYPCQPFSLAGKLKGAEDPRHLWPYIRRGVDIIRPRMCFFENVGNHLKIGYETVRGELQEMGYHVEEGIYAASEVGAPHRRERLFILAILDNSNHRSIVNASFENASDGSSKRIQERDNNKKFECSSELDNTFGVGYVEQNNEVRARRYATERSGEELGDPEHHGFPSASIGGGFVTSGNDKEKGQEQSCELARTSGREIGRDIQGIETMADTDSSRGGEDQQSGELRTEGIEQSPGNSWRANTSEGEEGSQRNQWPARPGEPQQAWESPRVISREAESILGIAVDGYSFREDLLRMAGNGVVEQQAEYAFRDLIRKHCNLHNTHKL